MTSDLFFADNDQSWKYETEQNISHTFVDAGNRFDMTGSDSEDSTVLNVSTFRRRIITRNIHEHNDDFDTTIAHRNNSTSKENPVKVKKANIVSKKNTKKVHVCPQCSRTYSYVRSLQRHLKYECGKPCKFACPYCNKKIKLLGNCHRHIRYRHKGQPVHAVQLY